MTTYNVTSGTSSGLAASNGDIIVVVSGGVAVATQVSATGIMAVSSGGVADFTTVSSGGIAYVFADGRDTGTMVDGAGLEILFGGVASGTVLSGGGTQEVRAAGATASATVVRGEEFVFSGGVAVGSVVSDGGFDEVEDSSTVTDTTVSSGGTEFVYPGGVASGTVVESGGVEVISGGTVSFAVVSLGGAIDLPALVFSSGGSAAVNGAGVLTVIEGNTSATSQLAGDYTGLTFQPAADNDGGTMVTLAEAPKTLVWAGRQDSDFGSAANWDDISNALDPAAKPPNGSDTTKFLADGGVVTGNGSVAALIFDSGGAWQLAQGAAVTASGAVTIGSVAATSLLIDQGSSLIATGTAAAIIANSGAASGSSVSVTGIGSTWQVAGLLDVGAAGSGELQLSGRATVTAGMLDAGVVAAGVGQIGVTGAGTELMVTGSAIVGDDGTGVLSVLSGATFSAVSLTIGASRDSSGALIISGTDSAVNVAGSLNIGTALGTGDLTVGPGAAVHASVVSLQGQVVLEGGLLDPTVQLINQGQTAGGFGTIAAGDIVDEGVIQAGGTKPSQKLLVVQGTVLGGGTLTANGTVMGANPTGVLQINAGGTLELTGPVINAATTTFTDNLTPTGTYTVNNNVIDVTFADKTGVLSLDNIAGFGGTIAAFQSGDSFVIAGGTLSNAGVTNGNTLTFADSGPGAGNGGTDQIIFSSAIGAARFAIVNSNTIQVPCFVAGTWIETEHGRMAVEALSIGDRLLTVDGRIEPVTWIGSRTINCRRHQKPETVWPVRVSAGAFGENIPVRDLYLSPDHAVFVDSTLVPVKLLVNGKSIVQVKRANVAYYHVELPRHDVILAEGLTVESYLDLGDKAKFCPVCEVIGLFPDDITHVQPDTALAWEAHGAAPLVMSGPMLARARKATMITCAATTRV